MKRVLEMPFLVTVHSDGKVRFRLRAPLARTVELCLENQASDEILLSMSRFSDGRFQRGTSVGLAGRGTLYRYHIDGGLRVPDPASRTIPQDVHGPSQFADAAAFIWRDDACQSCPWHDAVIIWCLGDGARLTLFANLGESPVEGVLCFAGTPFYLSQPGLQESLAAGRMPPGPSRKHNHETS